MKSKSLNDTFALISIRISDKFTPIQTSDKKENAMLLSSSSSSSLFFFFFFKKKKNLL